MKQYLKAAAVALGAVTVCASLAGCGKTEKKTVYEIPYYDGTTYEEGAEKPVYSSELWRRNDVNNGAGDPFILDNTAIDGFYYRYGTGGAHQFSAYRSSDLDFWIPCGIILENIGWTAAWAPEVVYDDPTDDGVNNGTYYFFFSMCFPGYATSDGYNKEKDENGNTDNVHSLFVATSSSPAGPFKMVDFTDAKSCGEENVRTFDAGDYGYTCDYLKYMLFEPIETNRAWHEIMPERIPENSDKLCNNIDASPFVDPVTKKKYLIFNHERQPSPILIMEMENWLKPLPETTKVIARCGYYTVEDYEKAQRGEAVETSDFEMRTNKVNEGPCMYYNAENKKYYLTYSVNGFMDPTYAVAQAVSDSPTEGFRKLTQAENGLILSADDGGNKLASGTGHHCFFHIGEKLYIYYHKHTVPYADEGRYTAVDEVKFVTIKDQNGEDLDVMYVNGPTVTPQPAIVKGMEYADISDKLQSVSVISGTLAEGSDTKWLNDGLLSYNMKLNQEFLNTYVRETEITSDTTFELSFADYETIRGLMIYNSKNLEKVFYKIKNVEFESEGKTYFIKELNIDEQSNFKFNEFELMYGNKVVEAVAYGGGVYAEFAATKVKKIRFTVEVPEGQTEVGISEVAVMGKVL
jgi:hypothetical protein